MPLRSSSRCFFVVLALASTRVLLGFVNWVKGLVSCRVGVNLTYDLRSQLVAKLHELGVGYYDKHQVKHPGQPRRAR